MNFSKFFKFSLIFVACCERILQPVTEISSTLNAVIEIIDEFYVKNQIQFDVRVNRENSGKLNLICDELLARIKERNSYFMIASNPDLKIGFGLKSSSIFLA